jgi:hypothetical protein
MRVFIEPYSLLLSFFFNYNNVGLFHQLSSLPSSRVIHALHDVSFFFLVKSLALSNENDESLFPGALQIEHHT